MTRETKAGLLMVVMLAGVFGFMVYKRLHQPVAVMAQQVPAPATSDSPSGDLMAQAADPFESPATGPGRNSLSSRENSPSREQVVPVRRATEPAVQESGEVEQSPPKRLKPRLPTSVAEERPKDKKVAPMKPSRDEAAASSEFDTFIAGQQRPSGHASRPTKLPNDARLVPRSESAGVPAELPGTDLDPFERPARQSHGAVETRNSIRPSSAEFTDSQQDAGNDADPFATAGNEVPQSEQSEIQSQSPGNQNPLTQPRDAAGTEFDEPPRQSRPDRQQSAEDPFSQRQESPSNVPALRIPSRDSAADQPRQAIPGDDRFGGFKPARGNPARAGAFADAEHSSPATVRENPTRRVQRPAPVSQIDEDFGTRATSRPLVAGDTYQVEPGDNFWTISRKKYGAGRYFMALAQHNVKVIPDPQRMRPGVTIQTPPAQTLEQVYPELIPQAAAIDPIQTASVLPASSQSYSPPAQNEDPAFFIGDDGAPMCRVGREDTLSGIAQRHLGRSSRWTQIFEMNRDVLTDGNTLKIGTILKLPADASRVDVVKGNRGFR